MTHPLRSACLLTVLILMYTQSALASTCSREDVDHYLDRGFTPAQVMDLCGTASTQPTPPAAIPAPAQQAVPAPIAQAPATEMVMVKGLTQEEVFKIKHAIDADDVVISNSELVYTRDRCHKFGLENDIGQRESACVITETRISRSRLNVERAIKGVFLLRDPELVVTAEKVQRSVQNPESIELKKTRQLFMDQFVTSPKELNIPLRKGFEQPKIAPLIQKLAL